MCTPHLLKTSGMVVFQCPKRHQPRLELLHFMWDSAPDKAIQPQALHSRNHFISNGDALLVFKRIVIALPLRFLRTKCQRSRVGLDKHSQIKKIQTPLWGSRRKRFLITTSSRQWATSSVKTCPTYHTTTVFALAHAAGQTCTRQWILSHLPWPLSTW